MKIVETVLFVSTGTWAAWRFIHSIRYADEKISFRWFHSSMQLFFIYTCLFTLAGLYDIWIHSTLTAAGIAAQWYLNPIFDTASAAWGGFTFAGILHAPFTTRRKIYDALSILAFLLASVLVGIVQIQYI